MKKHVLHERNEFTDVRHLIEWAGEVSKDSPAYSFRRDAHHGEVEKVTFGELRDDIRALTSRLLAMGCAGKHCVLVGKMTYERKRQNQVFRGQKFVF